MISAAPTTLPVVPAAVSAGRFSTMLAMPSSSRSSAFELVSRGLRLAHEPLPELLGGPRVVRDADRIAEEQRRKGEPLDERLLRRARVRRRHKPDRDGRSELEESDDLRSDRELRGRPRVAVSPGRQERLEVLPRFAVVAPDVER